MPLERRSFLKALASIAPAAALRNLVAQVPAPTPPAELHLLGAGQDRSGHTHSLGFSSLAFKVSTSDAAGNLFIIEHRNLVPDSEPALHMHLSQEEWFYVMDGEVALQVGDQRLHLRAGDSVLAPRCVPHTFPPPARPRTFSSPSPPRAKWSSTSSMPPPPLRSPQQLPS